MKIKNNSSLDSFIRNNIIQEIIITKLGLMINSIIIMIHRKYKMLNLIKLI